MSMMTTKGGRNGNGGNNKPAAVPQVEVVSGEMSEVRRKQLEANMAIYYAALAEVDDLKQRLFEAQNDLAHVKTELESCKSELANADSRVRTAHLEADLRIRKYQDERDLAVSARAELEVTILNIWSILRSQRTATGERMVDANEEPRTADATQEASIGE